MNGSKSQSRVSRVTARDWLLKSGEEDSPVADQLYQRMSAHRAAGAAALLPLSHFPAVQAFCVEVVRAGRAGPAALAAGLAHAADAHFGRGITRLDLEAQPGRHTAAALLHADWVKADVFVAGFGPVEALGVLRRAAAHGG